MAIIDSETMNDNQAKLIADGYEMIVGVLGVLEQLGQNIQTARTKSTMCCFGKASEPNCRRAAGWRVRRQARGKYRIAKAMKLSRWLIFV